MSIDLVSTYYVKGGSFSLWYGELGNKRFMEKGYSIYNKNPKKTLTNLQDSRYVFKRIKLLNKNNSRNDHFKIKVIKVTGIEVYFVI